jgi:hypothetical protein
MSDLFSDLPSFPPALPDDELQFLAKLPLWDSAMRLDDEEHAIARRLEKRGLIKISRSKDDPCASRSTWWAGKLPTAALRDAQAQP